MYRIEEPALFIMLLAIVFITIGLLQAAQEVFKNKDFYSRDVYAYSSGYLNGYNQNSINKWNNESQTKWTSH